MTVAESNSITGTITGGELVVGTLRALGVRFVFGVPGGQTLAITDAIFGANDIRFVTVRHEGAAACMADAIGRLTGMPGVCLATTGPGATNLLTGVGGAFRDSSPVLVLTCNNQSQFLDRDEAQAADHVSIFRPLTKWATLVTDPTQIVNVLNEAFTRAISGCPGPVLVDFARDALENLVPVPTSFSSESTAFSFPSPQRAPGDVERVQSAAALLRDAKRPVMWVGNGVQVSRASDAALNLASRLDMPVITTFNSIGTVPSEHPNVFGPRSRMGTAISSRVLTDADVLLAVGNSLNAISTSRWSETLPDAIIQIDVDPTSIGRYYGAQTLGIQGDARTVLNQLVGEIDDAALQDANARSRRARLVELREAKRQWREQIAQSIRSRDSVINPVALVQSVRSVTPDDAILVVDAGNPGVWTHLWEVRGPGTYLKPVGFGNMGFALPAIIAAKLERPQTPMVALIGDGSLGMSMGELETLGREGVNACIVVMNDSSYGNIRQEELVKYGRTIGVDFGDVDYAAIAVACGVDGIRVQDTGALERAVQDALASGRPWVVDARIDRDVNAWTYPPFRPHDPEE